MTSYRLARGGLVDRRTRLNFTFDGKALAGLEGDTLASALLANGIGLVGRSFKYHRPRGILTAGAAEPNALVTIGRDGRREANTRATVQALYDGLAAPSAIARTAVGSAPPRASCCVGCSRSARPAIIARTSGRRITNV
jgi:hypothetical protein